jgi:hypothetical protein
VEVAVEGNNDTTSTAITSRDRVKDVDAFELNDDLLDVDTRERVTASHAGPANTKAE